MGTEAHRMGGQCLASGGSHAPGGSHAYWLEERGDGTDYLCPIQWQGNVEVVNGAFPAINSAYMSQCLQVIQGFGWPLTLE